MAEEKNLPKVVETPQRWQDSKLRKFLAEEFQKEVTPALFQGLQRRGPEARMVALASSVEGQNGTGQTGVAFQYWAAGQEMRRALNRDDAIDCVNYMAAAKEIAEAKERKKNGEG